MVLSRRPRLAATLLASVVLLAMATPTTATIHELVASFCAGGSANVFPAGQSEFSRTSFLRALQSSGTVTVRPNTPTAGSITLDYNNDAPAGKFTGSDVFVEAIPGVWIELLEPDHAAFDNCTNFTFAG